jgi:hypothetical protein
VLAEVSPRGMPPEGEALQEASPAAAGLRASEGCHRKARLPKRPHRRQQVSERQRGATRSSGSRAESHAEGMVTPGLEARIPPTMAQVVSRSPRPATVKKSASS